MKPVLITILCAVALSTQLCAEPELGRDKGLSIHMLPKRVAELGGSTDMKWGLGVSSIASKRIPRNQQVFQAADKLIEFYRTLPEETQKNGVWIVTTDPDAYSDEETKLLDATKELCLKENIPLFICRGSELPNGWKRIAAEKPKQ